MRPKPHRDTCGLVAKFMRSPLFCQVEYEKSKLSLLRYIGQQLRANFRCRVAVDAKFFLTALQEQLRHEDYLFGWRACFQLNPSS